MPALPAVETRLVEIINAYWRERGYARIEAKVCEVADGHGGHHYVIRSNIGARGYPPGDKQWRRPK